MQAVAGQYYLDAGRAVGSMLKLDDDGEFEWRWVSNVDKHAQGTWRLEGDTIVLQPIAPGTPHFRLFSDEELARTKPTEAGTWLAIVGIPRFGPMADVEVWFEARSGKTVTQVSLPNGGAQVEMPATEIWARAGLRRRGSNDTWQWLDIPPERAKARLAGFSVDDIAQLGRPPFAQMRLIQQGQNLVVTRIDDKVLDPGASETPHGVPAALAVAADDSATQKAQLRLRFPLRERLAVNRASPAARPDLIRTQRLHRRSCGCSA